MTNLAWAIHGERDWVGFIGVGWFDWRLARPGLTIMTFATRREARAALPHVQTGFPKARVVRVTVRVETVVRP